MKILQCSVCGSELVPNDVDGFDCIDCKATRSQAAGHRQVRGKRSKRIMTVDEYMSGNLESPSLSADYHLEPRRHPNSYYKALEKPGPVDPRTQVRPLAPPGRRVA
jgi:hypothetical protein